MTVTQKNPSQSRNRFKFLTAATLSLVLSLTALATIVGAYVMNILEHASGAYNAYSSAPDYPSILICSAIPGLFLFSLILFVIVGNRGHTAIANGILAGAVLPYFLLAAIAGVAILFAHH